MNKKQLGVWVGVLALLVGAVYLFGMGAKESQSIKIGVLVPLTGKFASYGEDIRNGLSLALEDIQAKKGANFELVYEDSAADPKVALSGARKLLDSNNVSLVIAGPGSSANLAVAPMMEASRTIFMAISATPKLNDAGEYIFKINPDIEPEVERAVKYLHERGAATAAVMYDSGSDTQVTGGKYFGQRFAELGGTIAASEGYDGKSVTDFRAQLTKIKSKKPDVLYILAVEKTLGVVVKQAREIGFDGRIMSWSGGNGEEFFRGAGPLAEGVIITDYPFSCVTGTASAVKYCGRYEERFNGREPQHFGADAHDVLSILADVVKANKSHLLDKTKVQSAFTYHQYNGIGGDLKFDGKGNITDKDFVFRVVQGGKFVDVK